MHRPILPVVLGVAGLVPFLAATAWLAAGANDVAAAASLALYGLAILAFLGGVHWGRALSSGAARDWLVAVLPSLIGVGAFVLAPRWTLGVLAAAFAVLGAYDVALYRTVGPRWFAALRFGLTVVVVASLAVGAALAPAVGRGFGLLGG